MQFGGRTEREGGTARGSKHSPDKATAAGNQATPLNWAVTSVGATSQLRFATLLLTQIQEEFHTHIVRGDKNNKIVQVIISMCQIIPHKDECSFLNE